MAYVGKSIGARKLTWFPLIDGTDTELIPAAYGTGVKLSRLLDVGITPVFAEGTLESDDSVEDDVSLMIAIDVTITASQLTDAIRAALLGHTMDAGGGITTGKNDMAAMGALGWEELISSKTSVAQYKRVILYKGKFKEFAEKGETLKQGGITYQTHGLTARFYPREFDSLLKYSMREDTPAADAVKLANWFVAPQEATETYGTTVETPTATPDTGAIATGTDIVLASATPAAAIYYTVDGTTPTTSSTPYTAPIDVSAAKVIKAIAVKAGMNASPVKESIYTISA